MYFTFLCVPCHFKCITISCFSVMLALSDIYQFNCCHLYMLKQKCLVAIISVILFINSTSFYNAFCLSLLMRWSINLDCFLLMSLNCSNGNCGKTAHRYLCIYICFLVFLEWLELYFRIIFIIVHNLGVSIFLHSVDFLTS